MVDDLQGVRLGDWCDHWAAAAQADLATPCMHAEPVSPSRAHKHRFPPSAAFPILHYTDVMIKPDGVQRGLVGEIISRFEKKGFKLVQLKMMKVTKCAGWLVVVWLCELGC